MGLEVRDWMMSGELSADVVVWAGGNYCGLVRVVVVRWVRVLGSMLRVCWSTLGLCC